MQDTSIKLCPAHFKNSSHPHEIPFEMDLRKENRLKLKKGSDGQGKIDVPNVKDPSATRGKFLLAVTVKSPTLLLGGQLNVRVTDPEGNAEIPLLLCNYSFLTGAEGDGDKVEDILPIGTYLAVESPNPKLTWDNPSQVHVLSAKDVEAIMGKGFQTSSSFWQRQAAAQEEAFFFAKLKTVGNTLFRSRCYTDAVRFYDLALQYASTEEEKSMVLSNKAAALQGMRCNNAALIIAKCALELDPKNVKAVYRMGKSLMALGKFEEAEKELKKKTSMLVEENEFLTEMLERVKKHCSRKNSPLMPDEYISLCKYSHGIFNQIPPELRAIRINPSELQDVADGLAEYMGPVEIKQCQNLEKGRGLFATEDITPGQVILVSRAIAVSRWWGDLAMVSIMDLIAQVVNQINLDPTVGSLVYQLSAGKELGYLPEGDVRTSLVDIRRIEEVLRGNVSFSPSHDLEELNECLHNGLWVRPSFVNHSCSERNCVFEFYGDVLVVKAVEKIPKGAEILRSYTDKHKSYAEKQQVFRESGFTCTCKLCTFDLSLTMKKSCLSVNRKKIADFLDKVTSREFNTLEDYEALATFNMGSYDAIVDGVERLWKTHHLPGLFDNFKIEIMGTHLLEVGKMFLVGGHTKGKKLGQFDKAARATRLALAMTDHGPHKIASYLNLTVCLLMMKKREELLQCVNAIKEELLLWFGSLKAIQLFAKEYLEGLEEEGIDFFAN